MNFILYLLGLVSSVQLCRSQYFTALEDLKSNIYVEMDILRLLDSYIDFEENELNAKIRLNLFSQRGLL